MQRDDTAHAPATLETVELAEEASPALAILDLVKEGPLEPAAGAATERDPRPVTTRAPVPVTPGLRTAHVVAVSGRTARVTLRGGREEIEAALAPDVERELIEEAAAQKGAVLVEVDEDGAAVVVGLVQTRRPREVHVTGDKIVVEAEREVLLRAGRAALRLREDGDVELVGSRISAASRGLFRIVGRILRLN